MDGKAHGRTQDRDPDCAILKTSPKDFFSTWQGFWEKTESSSANAAYLYQPHTTAVITQPSGEYFMTVSRKLSSIGLAVVLSAASVAAMADVMVGGAAMLPSKDIIDNAVNSKDHTTLVAAVKAAGLVETLKGPGPFTVFAPTNAAFAALPAGTVDTLLKPENKAALTNVLTYHVVAGKWDAAAVSKMIMDGKGSAKIKTVSGGMLTAKSAGGKVMLTDEKGGTATVTIADVYQSNGVIHVIDKVLLPK
jgi:uncharacterized surface protein with fasciclin (FAS1) repeats